MSLCARISSFTLPAANKDFLVMEVMAARRKIMSNVSPFVITRLRTLVLNKYFVHFLYIDTHFNTDIAAYHTCKYYGFTNNSKMPCRPS
jgi:hypothetical protein